LNLTEKINQMLEKEDFHDYCFITVGDFSENYIIIAGGRGTPEVISLCLLDSARNENSTGLMNFLFSIAKGIEYRLTPDTGETAHNYLWLLTRTEGYL
jgi:hypothetical protein